MNVATSRMTAMGFLAAAVLACAAADSASTVAPDRYDAAVINTGRSAADVNRDALDHPADILRLTGIKPGMKVADVLAGSGYYSELLSYLVGPQGEVFSINNAAYDGWSEGREARFANARLANVVLQTVDLDAMHLAPESLDAELLSMVYHELYWVDPKGKWPKVDPNAVLTQLAAALKPGGVLLIVDHSAKPGSSAAAAADLHRIDENFAVHDLESHGFKLTARSDVLRHPDDARDLISYKGPMQGKTDRFVLVFRKKK